MTQTDSQNLALVNAFAAFNRHSSQLEASYAALQGQVRDLTAALARSHDARVAELTEKELIAARLTELLEALPAAVVVIDGNTRAGNLFGAGLGDAAWADVASARFARGNTADGEFRLRDGGWLALSRRPISGSASQILLFTDITDSKRLRESLQRRQRLSRARRLMVLALRPFGFLIPTPLAAAMLYAAQIGQRTGDQLSAACAGKIETRLRDLEGMVQDMLAFAGGTPSDEEVIDARGLLDSVAETAAADLPDHLRVVTELRSGDFALLGNRTALSGALTNLVTNAIQHSGESGAITLAAERGADGDIALSETDCGCGVSEALRQTIFEPFFTTRARGTGLGLAVVRSVAKAHGGDVELDTSQAGSTFTIRLPAINQYEALPAGANLRSVAAERGHRYDEPVTEEARHG